MFSRNLLINFRTLQQSSLSLIKNVFPLFLTFMSVIRAQGAKWYHPPISPCARGQAIAFSPIRPVSAALRPVSTRHWLRSCFHIDLTACRMPMRYASSTSGTTLRCAALRTSVAPVCPTPIADYSPSMARSEGHQTWRYASRTLVCLPLARRKAASGNGLRLG